MDEHNERVIESMYLNKSSFLHHSIEEDVANKKDECEYVYGDGSMYIDEDENQMKSFTISNMLWGCAKRFCSIFTFKSKSNIKDKMK